MKVKINLNRNGLFSGMIGEVVCKVKKDIAYDGWKKKVITHYIVQFRDPYEWSYFRRDDFKKIK